MMWMISSANSAQITCQFVEKICNVVSITAITQPNEVITISGMPSNYVNNTVQTIYFNSVNLAYFPTGIFKLFPNMAEVGMNGYTSNLTPNSFSNCPNLFSIYIISGNIPSVPAGFAQTCSKVVKVYLMQNNIARVDRKAFIGLKNLVFLDLSYNKITCLPYDLFQNTPSLMSIWFSNNKITKLDVRLFKNLPNLGEANFRSNMITALPYFNLTTTGTSPMVKGFNFFFDNNQISSINPNICNIFASRASHTMDSVYISNNPCVTNYPSIIDKYNCQQMAGLLRNCYSNWRATINFPITC